MKKLLIIFLLTWQVTGQSYGYYSDSTYLISETINEKSADLVSIDLTDTNIYITGSRYSTRSSDTIYFQRFSNELLSLETSESKLNPLKAHTTSGITVCFRTTSPTVGLQFTVMEGENRGHKFAVFQEGNLSDEFSFGKTDGPDLLLNISSASPGNDVLYEIALPNWSITSLSGLQIVEGHDLSTIDNSAKPVYVAYGNSITHGTGQNGTHKTYPFLISREQNTELYNVATGGSKTSVPVAAMLRDDFEKIDLMTILIGYNDYNGEGITSSEYYDRYLNFLRTFREKHVNTRIFCLTMTYTTNLTSVKSGIPADDFRQAVIDIVDLLHTEGDDKIFLVHGDSVSTAEMLKDPVHFSEAGALLFSESLGNKMIELTASTGLNYHFPDFNKSLKVISVSNTSSLIIYSDIPIQTVSLYNLSGKLMLKRAFTESHFDISSTVPGEYIISVDYVDKKYKRDCKLILRI